MRKFEMTFDSLNSEHDAKQITLLVIMHEEIDAETGAMLFTHGWGDRFQHQDKMEYAAENSNVVALSERMAQALFVAEKSPKVVYYEG